MICKKERAFKRSFMLVMIFNSGGIRSAVINVAEVIVTVGWGVINIMRVLLWQTIFYSVSQIWTDLSWGSKSKWYFQISRKMSPAFTIFFFINLFRLHLSFSLFFAFTLFYDSLILGTWSISKKKCKNGQVISIVCT